MMSEADARPFFPSIERVAIERVACTAPSADGLQITRWDCRTLQQIVIEKAIVDSIHYTTVARLLADASLQPHRSRYWKTATIDSEFVRRATQVLWCDENNGRLREHGDVIICVDEKPNIQALERCAATKPLCAGQITRREFEYKRHGTVNLLIAFDVYSGLMWARCLDKNDHQHFLWALRQISRR